MNSENCPCKKENCERHGKCDMCRAYHDGSKRKRPVACERQCDKNFKIQLLIIAACVIAIQCLFLAVKQIAFSFTEETLFLRSMVTFAAMTVILAIMIFYCRQKQFCLSAFPKKFGITYIIATVIAAVFYILTLFFVRKFTIENALMLFYGSLITPVFEELLFRGAFWNRLNRYFDKEWKTYLTVTSLFALWHIGYAVGLFIWNGGNLLNVIIMKVLVGAVFGVLTGALRYKTKNCYLGILIHGVLNAFG